MAASDCNLILRTFCDRQFVLERPTTVIRDAQPCWRMAAMEGRSCCGNCCEHPDIGWRAVGFLDDDPTKQPTRVERTPVLGAIDALTSAVEPAQATRVVLSTPKLPRSNISVSEACESLDVALARHTFGSTACLTHGPSYRRVLA